MLVFNRDEIYLNKGGFTILFYLKQEGTDFKIVCTKNYCLFIF
jgi:ferredoxin